MCKCFQFVTNRKNYTAKMSLYALFNLNYLRRKQKSTELHETLEIYVYLLTKHKKFIQVLLQVGYVRNKNNRLKFLRDKPSVSLVHLYICWGSSLLALLPLLHHALPKETGVLLLFVVL